MESFNHKDELMAEIYRNERMHEAKMARLISRKSERKSGRFNLIKAILKRLGNRSHQRPISQKDLVPH